jgi:AcrR family transcriptional regulator
VSRTAKRAPRLSAEQRRAQLLDSAYDALLELGFGRMTIEAVAARAGVTRPVVYDAFGDLETLMLALIERADRLANGALQQIIGAEPPADIDPAEYLIVAVESFLAAVVADPRTWRLVLMPPPGNSPELRRRIALARRRLAERVSALLDWGIAARGGPAGLDHGLLGHLIVAIGEDAARLMLTHPRRFTPALLTEVTRDLVAVLPASAPAGAEAVRALGLPELPTGPLPDTRPRTPAAAQRARGDGAPSRVSRRDRREQLLDVTLELLAEEGFAALSIEAIARRAGVNRVVVYRSFPNLPALLVALMHREDRRVRATLRGLIATKGAERSPALILLESLGSLLRAVAEQPATWRVALLRPESAPRALQAIVNRRRAAIAARIEPLVRGVMGELRPDIPDQEMQAIARMILTIGEEQARLALNDPEFPPERLLRGTRALLAAVSVP